MSNNSPLNYKTLFIFISLFIFSSQLFSQELNRLFEADTLYIYFKKGKNQIFLPQKDSFGDYYFVYGDFEKLEYYSFYHNKNKTSKEMFKKRKFLKKIKKNMIDSNYIFNLSFKDANYLFNNKKSIFIIDESDIKCSKIKLKEAKFYKMNWLSDE